MANAQKELLSDFTNNNIHNFYGILCADIIYSKKGYNITYPPFNIYDYLENQKADRNVRLLPGWQDDKNTASQIFQKFYDALDFEYDDGYGSQELFGIVWMKDGSWFERHEYDGAEGWEYKKTPPLPHYLKGEKLEGID